MSEFSYYGVLTKDQILKYIKSKKLGFKPNLDVFQIQCHSVDLRLGFSFRFAKVWRLTSKGREAFTIDYLDKKERFESIELENGQFFDILPKESVVATTLEEVKIPQDLMAVLYPRSSVNRRGLSIDMSGIVDAGYEGRLLVPIKNNTSDQVIRVYPGERFCQLVFYPLANGVEVEKSRWHKTSVMVGRLPEKRKIEESFILRGKIKELKERYKIN